MEKLSIIIYSNNDMNYISFIERVSERLNPYFDIHITTVENDFVELNDADFTVVVRSLTFFDEKTIITALEQIKHSNNNVATGFSNFMSADFFKMYLWSQGKAIAIRHINEAFFVIKKLSKNVNAGSISDIVQQLSTYRCIAHKDIQVHDSYDYKLKAVQKELKLVSNLSLKPSQIKRQSINKCFLASQILIGDFDDCYKLHLFLKDCFWYFFNLPEYDLERITQFIKLEELLLMSDQDRYNFLKKCWKVKDQHSLHFYSRKRQNLKKYLFGSKVLVMGVCFASQWSQTNSSMTIKYINQDSPPLSLLYKTGGYLISRNLVCLIPIEHWDFLNEIEQDLIVISDESSFIIITKVKNWQLITLTKRKLPPPNYYYINLRELDGIWIKKI